jgi:2-oxoglutarate dehydrogenase E2 component (dihydrolipoamide succinyltransferase)
MKVDVIMPQMGESIQEGTLTKWLKKVGETFFNDTATTEIYTDKVDAEIPAPAAGTLVEVKVEEGKTVEINTVVAIIETEAGEAAVAPQTGTAEPETASATAAPAAAPSPPSGSMPSAPPGAGPSGTSVAAAAPIPFKPRSEMTPDELRRHRSSPVVRKIAAEHGIDITTLRGTGLSGRVTKKDILEAVASGTAAPAPAVGTAAPALAAVPAFAADEQFRREPMSVMRRKIAEHMVLSRHTSAHVTTVFEIDFSQVESIRQRSGAEFLERHGVKLTYMPFIASSFKAYPVFNASIDGEDILYKKDINLGIAVALEWGLIVPVIRHAEDLSLSGVAKAIVSLAERARSKKLSPEDVQGGTFTVTNPGVFGGLFGTPIINQPQVAILGVGTVEKRPVVVNDAIAIHPMCYLALSFDHRLIDGATADQFMADLKGRLQAFDGSQV